MMNRIQNKAHQHHRLLVVVCLVIYDILTINFAYFLGIWLRFDFMFTQIPQAYLYGFLKFAPFYTIITIFVFWRCRLYNSLWQFASYNELWRILVAWSITTLVHIAGITAFVRRMPISYYMIGAVAQAILMVVVRFGYRFINLERDIRGKKTATATNVMIIGAGDAGQILIREIKTTKELDMIPRCVVDDDVNKKNCYIEGVPIVGGRDSILEAVETYNIDEIMFVIPTASAQEKRDILNICKETGCELKSVPGIFQLANGTVSLRQMKQVAVEDLLGRMPIKVNMDELFQYIRGKVILVTGGGGSIGSELCRQIAGHGPKQLIIFDIYENNAYDIEQELRRRYPNLNLVVLIGSVRDSRRINSVFETYKPDIVYHAAAHKHVPLMENSPNETIKNNVIGTYKTAYAALKNNTKRFVLISTDKAVNPTNIMGASKRLCEMVIQSMDAVSKEGRIDLLPFLHAHNDKSIDGQLVPDPEDHMAVDGFKELAAYSMKEESVKNRERRETQFVAVRFGNVLGSNGSVIPLFKKQIAEGGPVTVTHPDIVRYFMTIPEAVSLVLQAGTYARGGEIFVLDMGEPVKIVDLAKNLIRLSGHIPDVDIQIQYTGLRSGEKLYEEKLMEEEGLLKTHNDLIHIGKPIPFDTAEFLKQLEKLAKISYENSEIIVDVVADIVKTYHPEGR